MAYGVLVNVERCTQENGIHEINVGEPSLENVTILELRRIKLYKLMIARFKGDLETSGNGLHYMAKCMWTRQCWISYSKSPKLYSKAAHPFRKIWKLQGYASVQQSWPLMLGKKAWLAVSAPVQLDGTPD